MAEDETKEIITPEVSNEASVQESSEAHQEASPWHYSPETGDDPNPQTTHQDLAPINWTASEFVDHQKNSSWFMALIGIALLAIAIIYLMTEDIFTVVVIAVAAALFGVTAVRKPRTLQYQLSSSGVTVGGKHFSYGMFKSFAVLEEGAFSSVQLIPLKRFMPPISLYYPPDQEDQIVNMVGNYLPHEDRRHDPIDRLMRRVRF